MMRSNEGRPWRSTCEATVASPIFGSKSCLAHDCPFSCDRDDCPNECCSNDRSGAWPANFRCRAPGRHCDSRLMDPTCAERCVANHRLQRHRDSWIEILQEHQNHMHRHRAHQWCQLLDHGSSGDSGGGRTAFGAGFCRPDHSARTRALRVSWGNLQKCNLSHLNLAHIDLNHANLTSGTNLTGSDLKDARI